MADVMPNYSLERAKLELQIAEMELSMKRMYVRYAELDDERERIKSNEEATEQALTNLRAKLVALRGS